MSLNFIAPERGRLYLILSHVEHSHLTLPERVYEVHVGNAWYAALSTKVVWNCSRADVSCYSIPCRNIMYRVHITWLMRLHCRDSRFYRAPAILHLTISSTWSKLLILVTLLRNFLASLKMSNLFLLSIFFFIPPIYVLVKISWYIRKTKLVF